MANTDLLRTAWAARLLYNLQTAEVFATLCNKDYEGDLVNSNTVKINQLGDITIEDYDTELGFLVEGTSTPSTLSNLSASSIELKLTQQKGFRFKYEDITASQTPVAVIDNAMQWSAYRMADTVDKYISKKLTDPANLGINFIGGVRTPVTNALTITPTDVSAEGAAYDALVDIGTILSEKDVPSFGRWVVVTPAFLGLLQKDKRFIYNQGLLMNGLVSGAPVAGMNVYQSNNTTIEASSSLKQIVAGFSPAVTFAGGLKSMKVFEPENNIAQAVKGVYVFDTLVTRPSTIVVMTPQVIADSE
jgi:hypothetical protein